MKRRVLATVGLGAVVGIAAGALVTAGLVAGASRPGSQASDGSARLPQLPAAAARALPAFDGCEQLRRWYVREALPQVGSWGFGGWPLVYDGQALTLDRAAAPTAGTIIQGTPAVGSSDTGTNVQEAGIDEPDRAKTDGQLLVRVVGKHLVVTDVRGSEPRTLSRILLPGHHMGPQELLLVGDTVLVVGQEETRGYGGPVGVRLDVMSPILPGATRTHLTRVDISDPAAPRVESHQRIDGDLVAAREYGDGTVRIAVGTGYPVLDFVAPNRDRTPTEARRLNRDIVRRAPIEAWLPGLRQGDGRGRHPLLDCTDVRHPRTPSGFGTLSLLTLSIDDPRGLEATAITAAGNLAYSSADRFYVATLPSTWWDDVEVPLTRGGDRRRSQPTSSIYAFALDGADTRYAASGTVPGSIRDRWSFDELDGRLRVATALGRSWVPRENAVSVLEEDGGRLRVVGSLRGLGKGEQIQSVRWFDDLAVVVTFRQVDPLFTVDLRDPTRPRLLGALKIPGFSSYLHPVGGDLLLGLGRDGTRTGLGRGAQAAVFDLRDLHHVVRTDTRRFGPGTWLPVEQEPRTFTYLPDERTALVGVDGPRGPARLVALQVAPDGDLAETRSWRTSRWSGSLLRTLPLGDGRVALVDRHVRIVYVD